MSYLENLIMLMDNAGDKEIIVVCDFDGTITTSDSDVTMNAMAKIAGYDSDFSKARTALYNEYGRISPPLTMKRSGTRCWKNGGNSRWNSSKNTTFPRRATLRPLKN